MRVLCVLGLVLTAACQTPASVDGSKATAASVPTTAQAAAPLADVALPDLSAVAAPVQTQIRARFDAVQRPSGSAPADERAGQYGELGHVLSAATFFDEAVLSYRHAEALQPTVATWPYLRGHASLRKGDREDAAAAFERALTLKPDYLPARVWLGDVQLDLGKPEAARATFDAALARQPDSAPALFGAGRAALERRAYADAVQLAADGLTANDAATIDKALDQMAVAA